MRKDSQKRVDSDFAEGLVSLLAVLRSDSRPVLEIILHPNVKKDDRKFLQMISIAKKKKIPIRVEGTEFFDTVATGQTHGGVLSRVGERRMQDVASVFQSGNGFVFMLCGIEDPFNFGCAVRSFYAAGAGGMILTPRNWLSAAGVAIRSSAGTCEMIPCAVAEDPQELLQVAKEHGYKVVCASEKDSVPLYSAPLDTPVFLIIGGEKRGISKDYLDGADCKVRIPYGRSFHGSLTASAAAAVCAFEILRRKQSVEGEK